MTQINAAKNVLTNADKRIAVQVFQMNLFLRLNTVLHTYSTGQITEITLKLLSRKDTMIIFS